MYRLKLTTLPQFHVTVIPTLAQRAAAGGHCCVRRL